MGVTDGTEMTEVTDGMGESGNGKMGSMDYFVIFAVIKQNF